MAPTASHRAKPVLAVAPHVAYPLRTGGNLLVDRNVRYLSDHIPYVDLVAQDRVLRYQQGEATVLERFEASPRPKWLAAAQTVLRSSHFNLEKFLTPAVRTVALRYLRDPQYGAVLYSFLYSATLRQEADVPPRPALVWTHNDEFKWFQDLAQAYRNPLAQRAARMSEQWLHRFLSEQGEALTLLHVTAADQAGFERYFPNLRGYVVPIGVEEVERLPAPLGAPMQPLQLTFVGALGVKMNLDALRHFATHFYPALRDRFGGELVVQVVGSTPSKGVTALCEEQGWTLHPNVSDERLAALLAETTFTLLPFPYATGAKLKLLKSLAHGVPYLGTTHVQAQGHHAPVPCLLSDDPKAWAARLAEIQITGLSAEARQQLAAVAAQHSWAVSAEKIAALL